MTEHTLKQFDIEMEAVRRAILEMGGMVEGQLTSAIAMLSEAGDAVDADQVRTVEQAINLKQVTIDQLCAQIIARRQPAAYDLRMILMLPKIANDLERIGDEVKKILYRGEQGRENALLVQVRRHEVTRAAELAQEMLQMSLDVFARLDALAAAEVIDRDDTLDAAFTGILRQLISYMMEDPRTISAAIDILFDAKSLERIGDHAKNIVESVVQVVRGKDVRHASAEQIRAEVARD